MVQHPLKICCVTVERICFLTMMENTVIVCYQLSIQMLPWLLKPNISSANTGSKPRSLHHWAAVSSFS